MAKREISSTLKNLKFMQRAAQREEKTKKPEEEVKPDGNFVSPGAVRKCVVIMEGDPHPGSVIGRMSFQSFNPSVDKLHEQATNVGSPDVSNRRTSFRENRTSLDGAECSECSGSSEQIRKENGDLKRKQPEVVPEAQSQKKSPKLVQGSLQSSPNSSNKGFLKPPKHDKLDWSVLRPKSENRKNKRG